MTRPGWSCWRHGHRSLSWLQEWNADFHDETLDLEMLSERAQSAAGRERI